MVKLGEEEFVRRLNSALQDRKSESGWVNALTGSLDMLISGLAGPTKQSTLRPPTIAGTRRSSSLPTVPVSIVSNPNLH